MQYKLITDITEDAFVSKINEALKDGWELHGDTITLLIPIPNHDALSIKFYQPMTKKGTMEKNKLQSTPINY